MVTHRLSHAAERAYVTIRKMRPDDLDAVVQLDERVFGEPRRAYFERRLTTLNPRSPVNPSNSIGLVAEEGGAIVGFVMGTLTSGEFGFTEVTALMDSIAVHPNRQRRGIGQQLVNTLVAECEARGARDVYTLVNWKSWDMLKFFDSIRFDLAQTVLLHRPIGEIDEIAGERHEPV